jgi:hypothetical protein
VFDWSGEVVYMCILLLLYYRLDTIKYNKVQINKNSKNIFMPQQISKGTLSSPTKLAHSVGSN